MDGIAERENVVGGRRRGSTEGIGDGGSNGK